MTGAFAAANSAPITYSSLWRPVFLFSPCLFRYLPLLRRSLACDAPLLHILLCPTFFDSSSLVAVFFFFLYLAAHSHVPCPLQRQHGWILICFLFLIGLSPAFHNWASCLWIRDYDSRRRSVVFPLKFSEADQQSFTEDLRCCLSLPTSQDTS